MTILQTHSKLNAGISVLSWKIGKKKTIRMSESSNTENGPFFITLDYHPEREGGSFNKFSLKKISQERPKEPYVELPSRKAIWDIEPECVWLVATCDEKINLLAYAPHPIPCRPPREWLVDLGLLLKANSGELPTLPLDDSY